jgi:hypothetical protein
MTNVTVLSSNIIVFLILCVVIVIVIVIVIVVITLPTSKGLDTIMQ